MHAQSDDLQRDRIPILGALSRMTRPLHALAVPLERHLCVLILALRHAEPPTAYDCANHTRRHYGSARNECNVEGRRRPTNSVLSRAERIRTSVPLRCTLGRRRVTLSPTFRFRGFREFRCLECW